MADSPTGWWHLVQGTHRSWLPGDPRGFRSRRHRRHSSGDYRTPPPAGEHEGLHRAAENDPTPAVCIPFEHREAVVDAWREACRRRDIDLLAVSVGVLFERWLFFAEAEHAVGLYYGAVPQP